MISHEQREQYHTCLFLSQITRYCLFLLSFATTETHAGDLYIAICIALVKNRNTLYHAFESIAIILY